MRYGKVDSTLLSSKEFLEIFQKCNDWIQDEKNSVVGLAAPQIGFLEEETSLPRLTGNSWFILKSKPNQVIVNPEIIGRTGAAQELEGCLSCALPFKIKRAKQITVSYVLFNYKTSSLDFVKNETLEGWDARIFQHEYDHLNGILISQKGKK
jgi:peptide deformylase